MAKQTALVIVDAFPPIAHAAALRWWHLCRHLPEHGWDIIVLSRPHARYPLEDSTLPDLLSEEHIRVELYSDRKLPASSLTHNVKKNWPAQSSIFHATLPLADDASKWAKKAYYRAKGLIERFDVGLIVASGPPYATHRLAGQLSSDCDVPFLLDYQHHWSQAPQTKNHLYARSRGKAWEMDLLKRAQHITVTTRGIKEKLLQSHSFLAHGDVTIVPEMFDEHLYDSCTREQPDQEQGILRIVHAGVLSGNASLSPLLKALAKLPSTMQQKVQFTHVGPLHKSETKNISKSPLKNNIHVLSDSLPRIYQELNNADVLWLYAASEEEMQAQLGMYAGSDTPIMLCGPEGETSKHILAHQAGVVVPPKTTSIVEALQYFLELKQQGTRPKPKEGFSTQHNSVLSAADVSRLMGLAMKM